MRLLFVAVFSVLPLSVGAFVAIETDQSAPYEIVPVDAVVEKERHVLGELTGYPIMYEVSSDEPFTFTAQISQLANRVQQPFALLLIRQNDRGGGVQEVTRMNIDPSDWQRERDSQIGLSFTISPRIVEEVQAGTYRLEVSTPENMGKYLLHIGDQPVDTGYWDTVRAVRQTQSWFGYGPLSMVGSSLIYQPVGVFILLLLVYKVWQHYHRRRIVAPNHAPD